MHVPQTEVILRHDGAELARVTLPPGEYVIGRSADASICADTPLLSRQHARLVLNFDSILIEDLGSSNGTFVGDQPVTERTRLFPNQSVRLGDVSLEVHRQRTDSSPEFSLAPAQKAIRRHLPPEILTDKRYAIGSIVARGGMGAILDARQNATKRTVAMKVMLDTNDEADVLRFIGEAQVTAQLDHPNIVPIYELGVDEQDQLFYTMKMVKGITLKKVLERMAAGESAQSSVLSAQNFDPVAARETEHCPLSTEHFSLPVLLTVFQKVCDAVAFAHSKGVIHRDLKPENIMLGDFGSVLVMDWGLAKILGTQSSILSAEQASSLRRSGVISARDAEPAIGSTLDGTIMGTPQYMAPEQARGEIETLDQRADIYALGAILYHLLALRPSVNGKDAWDIVGKVGRGEIEPLDSPRSSKAAKEKQATPGTPRNGGFQPPGALAKRPSLSIPDSLAAVVRKAMALDKAARYPRVEDLQADILAYQNGFATSAEQAGKWKRITLFVRRNKAASIGTAAVLILSIGFMAKVIAEGRRAESALRELRGTAPTFHAQAVGLLNDGKFDDALTKVGFAIKLETGNPDYLVFRANLLQATQRLRDAVAEYREVLQLRPGDPAAAANLALCESLLRENGADTPLTRPVQLKLLAALKQQKRLVEAAPLNALIAPDIATAEAALRARLRSYTQQPGWTNARVKRLDDGTFSLELTGLALGDLSLLQGQPISILDLRSTNLTDLTPLASLPLKKLLIGTTHVRDLSPLRTMPLDILDLSFCKSVTDLSPLVGLPLRHLDISGTEVTDLAPLRGMPLQRLVAADPKFRSLEPLRGLPLTSLELPNYLMDDIAPLSDCRSLETLTLSRGTVRDLSPLARLPLKNLKIDRTNVTSLEPLRGRPLETLWFYQTRITEVSPLLDCPTLRDVVIQDTVKNLEVFRQLPNLKRISKNGVGYPAVPAQTAEEFWKEYDAQQAAGKK